MSEIIVPDLGHNVRSIRLLKWLKFQGDKVEVDEGIAHIETEDDVYAIVAPEPGILGAHLVSEGDHIDSGSAITSFNREAIASPATKKVNAEDEAQSNETDESGDNTAFSIASQTPSTNNYDPTDGKENSIPMSSKETNDEAIRSTEDLVQAKTDRDESEVTNSEPGLEQAEQSVIDNPTLVESNSTVKDDQDIALSNSKQEPPTLSGWGLWGQKQEPLEENISKAESVANQDETPANLDDIQKEDETDSSTKPAFGEQVVSDLTSKSNLEIQTFKLEKPLPSNYFDLSSSQNVDIWQISTVEENEDNPVLAQNSSEHKVERTAFMGGSSEDSQNPEAGRTSAEQNSDELSSNETSHVISSEESHDMAEDIKDKVTVTVPQMGESVAEGTISEWLVKIGDSVKTDDPLVSIETDKVAIEVPSPSDGVIDSLLVQTGDNIEVGSAIATLRSSEAASNVATGPVPGDSSQAAPTTQPSEPAESLTSPAVDRILSENDLSANKVEGTGPKGRISKADAIAASQKTPEQPEPSMSVIVPPTSNTNPIDSKEHEEVVPMSRLRKTIARRLKEAQNTAAILTTFNDVDMSEVMALRKRYRDTFETRHGIRLGFMSFFVKACVAALKDIPEVNAEIRDDSIVYKNHYDIAVAVGTDRGLVTPVVRNAHKLSLAGVEKDIASLAKKAREGQLSLDDLQGGTFTISNGGVYGSLMSTPIINPPQSGILGMHRIEERPVVRDGQVVIRPMMYIALSYDHRIIDGEEAVTFLVRVKENIEDPERLMLEV